MLYHQKKLVIHPAEKNIDRKKRKLHFQINIKKYAKFLKDKNRKLEPLVIKVP